MSEINISPARERGEGVGVVATVGVRTFIGLSVGLTTVSIRVILSLLSQETASSSNAVEEASELQGGEGGKSGFW